MKLFQIEDDEPSDFIKYSKFEPFMLRILKDIDYDPDDPETLMAAFKVIITLIIVFLDARYRRKRIY